MRTFVKRSILIILSILPIAAIVIISIRPTYTPRAPNDNHPLETMGAMGSWAFTNPASGESNARFFRPTLRRVQEMYNLLDRDEHGAVIYPDFYGGMAHSEGMLTLFIVEGMLEDAANHAAFRHLFEGDNFRHRSVEFSFADLLEARDLAIKAIDARPDCYYASPAMEPRVVAQDNSVWIFIARLSHDHDLEAGFREYVFDSPMIDVTAGVVLHLGGVPLHPIVYVAVAIIVVYFLLAILLGPVLLGLWVKGWASEGKSGASKGF